jgi:hypothetical protein
MPNGDNTTYNKEWCNERHDDIKSDLKDMQGRLRALELRIYAIIAVLQALGIGIGKLLS